jgi:SOS-response transcriptional repressor LexA
MKSLTLKEYVVFSFIRQFLADYNKSPTRREISEAFSITIQGADYFVHQLSKKEIIALKSKGIRNIRILKKYLGHQRHLW